jgi:uncharacterized damage-inducible protein DinB
MLELLRDMGAHCEWADAVFFHTWGKGPARDQEELRQRVQHILGVQNAFLAALRGEPPTLPGDSPAPTYSELKEWAVGVHSELNGEVINLSTDDLSRPITIPWIPECTISVQDALLQARLHSQHHRGQCMTRLKDFGGEPKNVDWIIWVWKQKPIPRWD